MIEAQPMAQYEPMSAFDDLAPTLDVLIHCLPAAALAMVAGLEFGRLRSSVRMIDLNYGTAADQLRRSVQGQHFAWEDGRTMLCAQAFQSFQYWTGHGLDLNILTHLIDEIGEIAST